MDNNYKEAHEAFVQNNNGTTLFETTFVLTVLPVAILFQRVVFAVFFDRITNIPTPIKFILEFISIILPFIITITFTELTPFMVIAMFITFIVVPLFAKDNVQIYFKSPQQLLFDLNSMRKGFLEEYRSFIMIATCICILAVDFQVFPRRFGKTENYGISLMDIGVGSVVLSGALVSRQARYDQLKILNEVEVDSKKGPIPRLYKKQSLSRLSLAIHTLKSNLPLVIIGFVRMILTKSVNYQEHTSEYGVHWNFFFTLALVSLSMAFLKFSPNVNAAIGVLAIVIYQIALSNYGLADYILNHPRTDLISANKEGICSFIGYLSIYLIGIKLGHTLFKPRKSLAQWRNYAIQLLLLSVVFGCLLYQVEMRIDRISRRMANLPYVLAILTINLFNFALNIIVTLISGYQNPSVIAKSINRNQLFIFLLGNILTGLINISMKTIYADTETSMTVITGYTLFLCLVALVLDKKNLTLKL
ncbi:phosphatidylinositol glycan [Tieghemostelium lacteum]|uniref:Phosphatidylinositol glycan n=1 Tax=Tieghemostelium lacteum TaxID=361077 RepID=A0A152A5R2_TIELA|nr:phosphatidylinositol glycan [Tieghemostelium lacteum]|eukprot:KYR01579.1 phosphatidylinositol glycan [Tieghemostelium lacteum]